MFSDEICFEAIVARDARFDGRFFTGVTSTGVYCRPICPSRTPKRTNCRFFACAAAARDAGFRPCKRCRPEGAPGVAFWQGTSETVTKAIRRMSVPGDLKPSELASAVAVGERQLRRLFIEHLGTTPGAMLRSRRLAFGAKLLGETDLPISRVAFAAGFGSVRRFNEVMLHAYGLPPRELRKVSAPAGAGVRLSLAYRPPCRWDEMCDFLDGRLLPGIESLNDGVYRRLVRTTSGTGCISVFPDERRDALVLVCEGIPHDDLMEVTNRTRQMFDLDADIASIETRLAQDATLKRLVKKRTGLRLPVSWNPYEAGVRAIIGQRISVKAARTITGRLADKLGTAVQGWEHYGLHATFPEPSAIADAPLEGSGLPEARRRSLRAFARIAAEGQLPRSGDPLEQLVEELQHIEGIGGWTAHYIAMRGYGEPDAFPHTDLGVVTACRSLSIDTAPRALLGKAGGWRPWRAYAVMHLWSHLKDV